MTEFRKNFEAFIDFTDAERTRAQKRRDYRDLKQWTEAEAKKLESRGQAAIVIDFVGKKVDALVGVEIQSRSDPKAYPRTLEHEDAAEAVTDALRYVEDNTSFDQIATEVFEQKIVEGYSGAMVDVKETKRGFEINIEHLQWDRIYFDPHSRRKDFKDAKYIGLSIWMDLDDAQNMFKGKADDLSHLVNSGEQQEGTTFDDRPNQWIDKARKRLRVNQEYYLDGGKWMLVYYSGNTVLEGPDPSPYLDEFGEPCCNIELQSDYIDRDNNRYGWIERLINPQDEINHRRSKALYMLSSAQVIAEQGAVKDPAAALRELRKAQGFVEVVGDKRFEVSRNIEMGQAQLALYQESKSEMDSIGVNPELQGRSESAISGRAFIARQQGGMTELARVFGTHSHWKLRIYRQMWARIKQFWDEQKWIRVTDNEDSMKWVGLNIPVRVIDQMLMQKSGMEITDILKQYGPKIEEALKVQPELGRVIGTVNNVAELDMDIIVEEAPDTINIQQEQFEVLSNLYAGQPTPQMFEMLIRLSTLRNKKEVLDMLKGDAAQQQAQQQEQQQAKQLALATAQEEMNKLQSEVAENLATAKDKEASAIERIAGIALQRDQMAQPAFAGA